MPVSVPSYFGGQCHSMDIPWFNLHPLERQRGGSRVLAVINKAAVNIHVHISLEIYFSFL